MCCIRLLRAQCEAVSFTHSILLKELKESFGSMLLIEELRSHGFTGSDDRLGMIVSFLQEQDFMSLADINGALPAHHK